MSEITETLTLSNKQLVIEKELTHVSLFSGIGGADLAAEWAGFRTVLQCEIDPFCRLVLRKHFPDVPIIEDVHDVTREKVEQAIADTAGFRQQSGRELATRLRMGQEQERPYFEQGGSSGISGNRITLLTAGVPCQPASTAGKRRGKADDRWLWPEALRVLSELQPAWAVFENPAGIISLDEFGGPSYMEGEAVNQVPDEYSAGLDELCGQIEQAGYAVQPVLIPACAVGAYHRRDRVFIICHAIRSGLRGNDRGRTGMQFKDGCMGVEGWFEWRESIATNSQEPGLERPVAAGRVCAERLPAELLPDWAGGSYSMPEPLTKFTTNTEIAERRGNAGADDDTGRGRPETGGQGSAGVRQREIECELRVVADGLPVRLVRPVRNRVSQLKAYGNAIVPEQIYPVLKAIAEIENGQH